MLHSLRRRDFLKSCALLAGMAPPAGAYQIGCWTRPWDKADYPEVFEAIAAAGYKYAGLMGLRMGGRRVDLTFESTPEQLDAIGRRAGASGLKVISVWAGQFPFRTSIEAGVAGLKRMIDNCVACGSPDLLLAGVVKPEETDPYYRVVAECCDYGASKGVGLSLKPHGGTNATGHDCRRLVERVGHRNFRIFYDPGNIYYYSGGKLDPVEDVPAVDGLVVAMSVKDFRMPKEVMVTPGTGMVNFRALFARMRQGGFTRGPLVVECLDRGDTAHVNAEARKARLFVERLLLSAT